MPLPYECPPPPPHPIRDKTSLTLRSPPPHNHRLTATMEAAAVSLQHHHGALPLPATLPPPHNHHHRSSLLPIPIPQTTRRPCVRSSSSKPPAARLLPARSDHAFHPTAAAPAGHYSSRAATGYAAALADACVRAGTLRRASSNARAFLLRRQEEEEEQLDGRVAALVRMLVSKGKPGMVAEVMAEFASICDKLLPRPAPRAQYHGY